MHLSNSVLYSFACIGNASPYQAGRPLSVASMPGLYQPQHSNTAAPMPFTPKSSGVTSMQLPLQSNHSSPCMSDFGSSPNHTVPPGDQGVLDNINSAARSIEADVSEGDELLASLKHSGDNDANDAIMDDPTGHLKRKSAYNTRNKKRGEK